VFCLLPRSKGKPVPDKPDAAKHKRQSKDKPGVVVWYERMGQQDSAAIYAERFPSERPDADVRNTGLYRFLVRGVEKVNALALRHAIAYKLLQIPRLMLQVA
jgi:hypothetical protein